MATYAVRYTQPLLGAATSAGYLVAVPGVSVLIRQNGAECDVFADNVKTPMANPVPTGVPPGTAGVDTTGNLTIYLEPGRGYSAVATVGATSTTFAIPDISLDSLEPIPAGAVEEAMLDFGVATQAELDAVAAAKQDVIPSGTVIATATLTTDGDLLTRAGGVPARITRAGLAADPAFSAAYVPVAENLASFAPSLPVARRPAQTIISTFASGHGFTVSGAASSDLNETTDPALGSQAASVTTNGAGGLIQLTKTAMNLDSTGKDIRVWVKVSDISKLASLELMVQSNNTAWADYWILPIQEVTTSPATKAHIKSGEWVAVTLSFGNPTGTVGAPTRSYISGFRFRTSDNSTGPITVKFGGLAFVPLSTKYPNGVVSLTFDDNTATDYTDARKKLDQYGWAATAFIIPDLLDTPTYLTLAQLRQLQDLSGWEVAGHAATNAAHALNYLYTLSSAGLTTELLAMKRWLIDNGFTSGADLFAWPHGYWTAEMARVASRFFAGVRHTSRQMWETAHPADPYRLRAFFPVTSTSLTTLNAEVDRAIANGSWLIYGFHRLGGTNEMTVANFNTFVDSLASKGIAVRPVGAVLSGA